MLKKLRSVAGETLTETLVAVLIIALASAGLAAMIITTTKLNKAAQENDKKLFEAVSAAESKSGSGDSGTVDITVGNASVSMDVTFYCGDEDMPIWSYSVN